MFGISVDEIQMTNSTKFFKKASCLLCSLFERRSLQLRLVCQYDVSVGISKTSWQCFYSSWNLICTSCLVYFLLVPKKSYDLMVLKK